MDHLKPNILVEVCIKKEKIIKLRYRGCGMDKSNKHNCVIFTENISKT